METKDPAVQAEALVKHYGGRNGVVEAVRGVDLRVEAGEIFGFLGPNGAGKSTTIRMLTTLLSITSGTARAAGVDAPPGGGGSPGRGAPPPPAGAWAWRSRRRGSTRARPVASCSSSRAGCSAIG